MMKNHRCFSYFFFENFDAEKESKNPLNPRKIVGKNLDDVLSEVADNAPGTTFLENLKDEYEKSIIDIAVECGALRVEKGSVYIDTPIFLGKDLSVLQRYFSEKASGLAATLESRRQEIYKMSEGIDNGFSPSVNLYHILCGMCFDGLMMDELGKRDIISIGRKHPSGLDYLMVIYEKSQMTSAFSDGLLCSYNRILNEHCALESFGDAAGNRLDCYRYFRLREQGKLSKEYSKIHEAMQNLNEDDILNAARSLVLGQRANTQAISSLELLGYLSEGRICVPLYKTEHDGIVYQLEKYLEEALMDKITDALYGVKDLMITSVAHGVSTKEIVNECWHILFGNVNDKLVQSGFVAAPPHTDTEGRYLQAIEVY